MSISQYAKKMFFFQPDKTQKSFLKKNVNFPELSFGENEATVKFNFREFNSACICGYAVLKSDTFLSKVSGGRKSFAFLWR